MGRKKQFVKVKIGKSEYVCKVVEEDGSTVEEKLHEFDKSNKINCTYWENDVRRILPSNSLFYEYLAYGGDGEVICSRHGKFESEKPHISPKRLESKIYSVGDDLIFYTYVYPLHSQKGDYFDECKFSSFVSLMINDNPEDSIQLQRYDLRGRPHANEVATKGKSFETVASDEKECLLYQKYYGKIANFPHFHFYSVNGLDAYAIDLNHLIEYFSDLMLENNKYLLKYDLGMPFLKMKQKEKKNVNYKKFLGQTFMEIQKSADTNNPNDISCMTEFLNLIQRLDLGDLLVDDLTCCFMKLRVLKFIYDLGVLDDSGRFRGYDIDSKGKDFPSSSGGDFSSSLKVLYSRDNRKGGISAGLRKKLIELQLKLSASLTNNKDYIKEIGHDKGVSIDKDNARKKYIEKIYKYNDNDLEK